MLYLHAEARRRGAPRIRLKVYPENTAAVELYRSLGYVFEASERGQLVGFKTLAVGR
jgi:ribosomal protein S18 acetylase RimI-like enzyme